MEQLLRANVIALNQILGVQQKVLDDGFVRVIDYMGSDESIVQAARVSYGKGTKKLNEDKGLIRYLMRNNHTTPFEMCEIKFHIRVPMDCWRQWIRHRTANVNEYSTRYSLAIDSAQKTVPDQWRFQSKTNKQGSDSYTNEEVGKLLSDKENGLHIKSREIYEERINFGIAREQSRKDLPLSTYTEAYWKIDLHNLFHFLALRMDAHAQYEIRQYATIIGEKVVSQWCPLAWEAFLDYQLGATRLSKIEIGLLELLNTRRVDDFIQKLKNLKWIDQEMKFISSRERMEFDSKLSKLAMKGITEIIEEYKAAKG